MNIGGDPGRDDYGLPPVDIEIPDDARELDRDVHAYYRELRAERRRMLARRLYAPLNRDGMVLPLLAGCLALTLLAGTLLTVLTTGQGTITNGQNTITAGQGTTAGGSSGGRARPAPSVGGVGGPLPHQIVMVNGQPEPLNALNGDIRVLALVPPRCRCRPDVQKVAQQAQRVMAVTYLVGTGTQETQLRTLSRQAGLGRTQMVLDSHNALPRSYHPAILTVIVVGADGLIYRIVRNPARDPHYRAALRLLVPGASVAPAGTKALPRPGPGGPEFVAMAAVGW